MSAASRVAGAVPATLLVWATTTVLSLPVAAASEHALSKAVGSLPRGEAALTAPGGAVLMEAIGAAAESSGWSIFVMGLVATVAMALASPLLCMLWLSSLAQPMPLREAALRGARLYLRALAVAAMAVPAAAILVGLLTLIPLLGHLALADTPNERFHDLAVLALGVPALLGGLWAGAVHDLARATLVIVDPHPVRALVHAVRRARPAAAGAYTGWLALGLFVGLLGHVLGSRLDGTAWWQPALVVLATQVCALARFGVRARWLAAAIERVT